MMVACHRGHTECFKHFLQRESRVKNKEFRTKRNTVLITAVTWDYVDIMRHIIDHLPKVHRDRLRKAHICEDLKTNILVLCCETDSINCIKSLVEEYGLLEAGYKSHKPLPQLALECVSQKCLEYLIRHKSSGVGLHVDSEFGYNVGHYAAQENSREALRIYMETYPDFINAVSHKTNLTIEGILLSRGYWDTFRWFRETVIGDFPQYSDNLSKESLLYAPPFPGAITSLQPLKYFPFDVRRDWFRAHVFAVTESDGQAARVIALTLHDQSATTVIGGFVDLYKNIVVPGREDHFLDKHRKFTFSFGGQEGQGYGVVRQYLYQLMQKMPVNDMLELTHDGTSHQWKVVSVYHPHFEKILAQTRLLGCYAAIQFLMCERLTRVRLTRAMFTHDILADDLKDIDLELYNNMIVYLRQCTEDELQEMELSFTRTLEDGTEVEIIENGRELHPSKDTEKCSNDATMLPLETYLQCWVQHYITHDREALRGEFINGFQEIIHSECIEKGSLFTVQEVSDALWCDESAMEDVDIQKWKDITKVEKKSAQVEWFWDMVENHLDSSQRRCLLMFVSGSALLPETIDDGFIIMVDGNLSTEQLPHTRTCIRALVIPRYATPEKMRHKFTKIFETFTTDDMNFGFI